jgi:hypothetical protein
VYADVGDPPAGAQEGGAQLECPRRAGGFHDDIGTRAIRGRPDEFDEVAVRSGDEVCA